MFGDVQVVFRSGSHTWPVTATVFGWWRDPRAPLPVLRAPTVHQRELCVLGAGLLCVCVLSLWARRASVLVPSVKPSDSILVSEKAFRPKCWQRLLCLTWGKVSLCCFMLHFCALCREEKVYSPRRWMLLLSGLLGSRGMEAERRACARCISRPVWCHCVAGGQLRRLINQQPHSVRPPTH